MRLLGKLAFKFFSLIFTVLFMASVVRYGQRFILQASGLPPAPAAGAQALGGAKFSSEEADLMATVLRSAVKLLTGAGKREELEGELSDKLYAGRANNAEMKELGIELIKPGDDLSAPAGSPNARTGSGAAKPALAAAAGGAKTPAAPGVGAAGEGRRDAALGRVWASIRPYSLELSMIPVVMLGMLLINRIRRRRALDDGLILPELAQGPTDSEPYEMKYPVRSLDAEGFELLVAQIYQRQGYRVTMPSALSGGRGGDFMLLRKSERMLVQCKRLNQDHRIPVERVRELHEAVTAAGALRGMLVATCGYTWDARNFAKTKGMTLINARTLDELISTARETSEEDLLAIGDWASRFIGKVKFTESLCPACEAPMDEIATSHGTVWTCSQRPDCRGRRCSRKYHPSSKTRETNSAGPDSTCEVAA